MCLQKADFKLKHNRPLVVSMRRSITRIHTYLSIGYSIEMSHFRVR